MGYPVVPPPPGRTPPRTALERSLWPATLLSAGLLVLLVLLRVRLPPLPYSLVILFALWIVSFLTVFSWQSRRRR